MNADAKTAAESVFRQESGRILATLIRFSGSFDRAEEAMQEAFSAALMAWPEKGIPQKPAAWITTAAHRKVIDQSRREKTWQKKQDSLRYERETFAHPGSGESDEASMHFPDDRLRLIFTCCHPALRPEAQVALTLKTLGGLTVSEIAKAFLISEATVAQRIVRAKRKIEGAGIPYEVPSADRLPGRLASVQAVHAAAKTPGETDWRQIAALYRELDRRYPSAVVSLNYAVAVAMSEGLERGLVLINEVGGTAELESYYLYHAARADILRRMNRQDEALQEYQRAIALTTNTVEQQYLRRRIDELMP